MNERDHILVRLLYDKLQLRIEESRKGTEERGMGKRLLL